MDDDRFIIEILDKNNWQIEDTLTGEFANPVDGVTNVLKGLIKTMNNLCNKNKKLKKENQSLHTEINELRNEITLLLKFFRSTNHTLDDFNEWLVKEEWDFTENKQFVIPDGKLAIKNMKTNEEAVFYDEDDGLLLDKWLNGQNQTIQRYKRIIDKQEVELSKINDKIKKALQKQFEECKRIVDFDGMGAIESVANELNIELNNKG